MNPKRLFLLGFGILFVLGLAMATTYLCLKHFAESRHTKSSLGLSGVHAWAHEIGLNKEQEEKLKPFEAPLEKNLESVQVKLAQQRIALCHLIQEEPSDSNKIDQYAQQISSLEAEQQKLIINHLIVMRDILSPGQRDKLFRSIMHEICVGCRQMVPGQKCLCGRCDMKGYVQ